MTERLSRLDVHLAFSTVLLLGGGPDRLGSIRIVSSIPIEASEVVSY